MNNKILAAIYINRDIRRTKETVDSGLGTETEMPETTERESVTIYTGESGPGPAVG